MYFKSIRLRAKLSIQIVSILLAGLLLSKIAPSGMIIKGAINTDTIIYPWNWYSLITYSIVNFSITNFIWNAAWIMMVGAIIESHYKRQYILKVVLLSVLFGPAIFGGIVFLFGTMSLLVGPMYVTYSYIGLLYGAYINHKKEFSTFDKILTLIATILLANQVLGIFMNSSRDLALPLSAYTILTIALFVSSRHLKQRDKSL